MLIGCTRKAGVAAEVIAGREDEALAARTEGTGRVSSSVRYPTHRCFSILKYLGRESM